jgi:hypothetical protein
MIIPAEGVVTFDVPQNAVDVSSLFYEIQIPGARFLNSIALGDSIRSVDPKWFDDRRLAIGTTISSAYTAADGLIQLASVEGIRVGSVFSAQDTIFKATAVNPDTHTVSVTVLSDDDNHSIGDEIIFIGNAREQGSTRQDSDINTPIERFNRTQIFDDAVVITGTQEAVDQYGNGVMNLNLENAVKKKLQRLYLLMGRAIWRNPRVSPDDNNSEPLLGGLNWFISQYGQKTSGAFSHANISSMAYDLYQAGLVNPEIWINPNEADKYRQLDASYIQVDAKVTFAGRPLPTLLYTTKGQEIPIKIDPQCPEGQHYLIDPSLCSIHPLSGRQFFVKRAQDDDDNKKARIIGEYTMKVFNSTFMGRYTPTS